MRRSRLSAGTWLALSAGVLAVATLVAIGAALLASHQLTEARGRVVDRVDPPATRPLRARPTRWSTRRPASAASCSAARSSSSTRTARACGRRTRAARARPPRRGRDARPAAARPRRRRAPGSPTGATSYARPTIGRVPPRRRGPVTSGRRGGQGALRRAARRAPPPAGRPRRRPRRRAAGPGQRGDGAEPRADLRRDRAASARSSPWRWSPAASSPCRSPGWPTRRARSPRGELRPRDRAQRPARPGRARRRRRGDARADRPRSSRRCAPPRRRSQAQAADARALQRRARAVRLRRLARPPGAAAQGDELLPDARAPLRGPARRARRPVHRLRRRRREAHAGR